MSTTVEDIFCAPIQQLPSKLAPLPGLLRRAQSKACSNASLALTGKMVPHESHLEARNHTYLGFKNSFLASALSSSPQAHSVLSQIIALIEMMSFEQISRMTVIGALSTKINDIDFLITFRDQLPRS